MFVKICCMLDRTCRRISFIIIILRSWRVNQSSFTITAELAETDLVHIFNRVSLSIYYHLHKLCFALTQGKSYIFNILFYDWN